MKDELLDQSLQPEQSSSDTEADSSADEQKQEVTSERVFDFSDGDIKPVQDTEDGPITPSVNQQIAEALRNPLNTVRPVSAPTQATTPTATSISSAYASAPTTAAVTSAASAQQPSVTPNPAPIPSVSPSIPSSPVSIPSIPTNTNTPSAKPTQSTSAASTPSTTAADDPPPKPIPRPPIDMRMQPPPIKVYSQIRKDPPPAPIQQKQPATPEQAPEQKPKAAKLAPETPIVNPVGASTIEEVLRKAYSKASAKEGGSAIIDVDADLKRDFDPKTRMAPQENIPANSSASSDSSMPVDANHSDPSRISSVDPLDSGPANNVATQAFLKSIRTYESDVAEAMSKNRHSTASIALAENKRNEQVDRIANNPESEVANGSSALLKITMLVLGIVVAGAGVYGGYYLYMRSPLAQTRGAPAPRAQQEIISLIPADSQSVVSITGYNSLTLERRIADEVARDQALGTIREIVFAHTDASGNVARVPALDMINLMGIPMPDIIVRTLSPEWMLGVHVDDLGQKHVFVALTTTFFQNTFAGMLQWEQLMPDDLKRFISRSVVDPVVSISTPDLEIGGNLSSDGAAATTSDTTPDGIIDSSASSIANDQGTTDDASATTTDLSSTPELQYVIEEPIQSVVAYVPIRGSFSDKIVRNKDVRAFITDAGQTLFVYSFIDNSTLVIASDEAVLMEIMNRLDKSIYIR